jgi:hypothetical protein
LNTLYVGIGYPETWRDYSGYEVKADDIFGNLWRGSLFDYHRNVARLGHPVDRKEWGEEPQTVDATELPLQNALNFPAAYLQPLFFDPQATAAVNYGQSLPSLGTISVTLLTSKAARLIPQGVCEIGGNRLIWRIGAFQPGCRQPRRAVRRLQTFS